jgi:hypothetical protein
LCAMPQQRTVGRFSLLGVAVSGAVIAHWLAYVLAIPAAHARAEVLAASGHSYWVMAIKMAVVLGLAALGALFLRHLGRPPSTWESGQEAFSAIAARLSLLQVIAFVALEVTERLMVGAPVAHLFHHRLFLMGLALQLIVASAGALLLLWFSRTVERVAEALRRPRLPRPCPAVLRTIRIEIQAIPVDPVADGVGLRGPPPSS